MKYLKLVIPIFLLTAILKAGTPTNSPRAAPSPQSTEQLSHLDKMWKYGTCPLTYKDHSVQYFVDHDINKVLSLSSGPITKSLETLVNLGEGAIEVWATDIAYSGIIERKGKFFKGFMDNTKPFPFSTDLFDMVRMTAGLCVCPWSKPPRPEGSTCGGIKLTVEGMSLFFFRVLRVLNSDNPNAVAVLEGGLGFAPPDKLLMASAELALSQSDGFFTYKLVKDGKNRTSGLIFYQDIEALALL